MKSRILFAAGLGLTLCFAPITRAEKLDEMFAAAKPVVSASKEIQALTNKANSGNSSAQFKLAFMYENGKGGLKRDESYAISWYEEAARNGNKAASKRLKVLGSVN